MDLHIVRISQSLHVLVPFCLVFRTIVEEPSDEDFLEPFGPPIRLRMVGRSVPVLNAEHDAHFLEEVRANLTPVVGEQVARNSVRLHAVLLVNLCHGGCHCRFQRNGPTELVKPMGDNESIVMPFCELPDWTKYVHSAEFQ